MRELVDQWLEGAEADLIGARTLLPQGRVVLGLVAYHAQQAAEKYLKAFLTHHQIEFPKTHALDELLRRVEAVNRPLADSLRGISVLTPYAVETRYPGGAVPGSSEEAQRAIELAEQVRDAVLKALGRAT